MWITKLVIAITATYVIGEAKKTLHLQGFLPMTGTGWISGGACIPAVLMALRDVNNHPGLLTGYNLSYSLADTQCNPGLAAYKLFQSVYTPPTKIMLLGTGCSVASESTASVSYLYNLTQISPTASSPVFDDRKRFPNFFRLESPDHKLNPAKIALMREFNWKKVATINHADVFFSLVIYDIARQEVIEDFIQRINQTDITIISQEIFQHDPYRRIENLKKHDARIIVAACYEDKIRLVLCAAYRLGLYGPKIVWIFMSWYSSNFWSEYLEDVPCSADEMKQAVEGALFTGVFYNHNSTRQTIAGMTVSEFYTRYRQEDTYDIKNKIYEEVSANLCYDHVWVAAMALNCTSEYLRQIHHPKTIDQFTYEDSDINDVIMTCLSRVSFTGVTGKVWFVNGYEPPDRNVIIERMEDGQRVVVGTYIMEEKPMHFEWLDGGIKWKDGHIPKDSTLVIREQVSVPVRLYAIMVSLSAMGILLSISFFVFNIKYRHRRIVKLSSPNINNVLLVGCSLTYCTVILASTGCQHELICKVRTFCFCVGFTVAFGAMFSKMWRVYKIFTNQKLLKVTIKDYQLIGVVCLMSGVVVALLILWEAIGPQVIITKELHQYVYSLGNDAEVHPFVCVCCSPYSEYFSWTIYIVEGTLLAFGTFLAWETRHVNIKALNDSHQIGICLYSVVILSVMGLVCSLVMEDNIVVTYGVTSACVVIGTTLTQMIVFIPKVMAIFGHAQIGVQTNEGGVLSTIPSVQIASTTINPCSSAIAD